MLRGVEGDRMLSREKVEGASSSGTDGMCGIAGEWRRTLGDRGEDETEELGERCWARARDTTSCVRLERWS